MSIEENTAKSIMNDLFRDQHKSICKDLDNLITKNDNIITGTHVGFTYQGSIYCLKGATSWSDKPELHESLHPEIENLLNERARMRSAIDKVDAYLRRALNLVKTPADMLAILPEQIHNSIPYTNISKLKTTLDKEILMAFNKENMEYIEIIKEQVFKKLILRTTHGL